MSDNKLEINSIQAGESFARAFYGEVGSIALPKKNSTKGNEVIIDLNAFAREGITFKQGKNSSKVGAQHNTPHFQEESRKAICWFKLEVYNANNAAAHIDHITSFNELKKRVVKLLDIMNKCPKFVKGFAKYNEPYFQAFFMNDNNTYYVRKGLMVILYRNTENLHMLQADINIRKSDIDFLVWLEKHYPTLYGIFTIYLDATRTHVAQGVLGAFVTTDTPQMALDYIEVGGEKLFLHHGKNDDRYVGNVVQVFYEAIENALPAVANGLQNIESSTIGQTQAHLFQFLDSADFNDKEGLNDINRFAKAIGKLMPTMANKILAFVKEYVNQASGNESPSDSVTSFTWGLASNYIEGIYDIINSMPEFINFFAFVEERLGSKKKDRIKKFCLQIFKLQQNLTKEYIGLCMQAFKDMIEKEHYTQDTKSTIILKKINTVASNLYKIHIDTLNRENDSTLAAKRHALCSSSEESSCEEDSIVEDLDGTNTTRYHEEESGEDCEEDLSDEDCEEDLSDEDWEEKLLNSSCWGVAPPLEPSSQQRFTPFYDDSYQSISDHGYFTRSKVNRLQAQ